MQSKRKLVGLVATSSFLNVSNVTRSLAAHTLRITAQNDRIAQLNGEAMNKKVTSLVKAHLDERADSWQCNHRGAMQCKSWQR